MARAVWNRSRAGGHRQLAIDRPATCAEHFDRVVVAVLVHLFVVKQLTRRRRGDTSVGKMAFHCGHAGLLGGVRACTGVGETQAKGSLHGHFNVWSTCGPQFFAQHLHTRKGRRIITEANSELDIRHKTCVVCGTTASMKCGVCKHARYCSRRCQRASAGWAHEIQ